MLVERTTIGQDIADTMLRDRRAVAVAARHNKIADSIDLLRRDTHMPLRNFVHLWSDTFCHMMASPATYRESSWVPFLEVVVVEAARNYTVFYYQRFVSEFDAVGPWYDYPLEVTELANVTTEAWRAWYRVEGVHWESSTHRYPFHTAVVETIELIQSFVSVACWLQAEYNRATSGN